MTEEQQKIAREFIENISILFLDGGYLEHLKKINPYDLMPDSGGRNFDLGVDSGRAAIALKAREVLEKIK